MSGHIVAKFGGTSVKTAKSIKNVAKIVAANPEIKIVVVSAVGGITNLLVDFCNHGKERPAITQKILDIHYNLTKELNLDINEEIESLMMRIIKIKDYDTLKPKEIDYILSLGEDLSSLIISKYLNLNGIKARYLDARKFLITDHNYGKAIPDLNRIKQFSFGNELSVTQGFIGATLEGDTTTLGRGGSDYSAALAAEAINAKELLIYTDVPGVYTMDPNVISTAQPIAKLGFQEMAEMANFGAKILHPATLEPCIRAKIPIRILSTFEPEKPGTIINTDEKAEFYDYCIRAITMRKKQVLVNIKSIKMLNACGFLASIFETLARHKISIDLITTSEVSVALTVDYNNLGAHNSNPFIQDQTLLTDLKEFAEITVEEDLTLVAVIGYGLNLPGIIQKILDAITSFKIRLVCYGASNSNIGILVPDDHATDIVKILHRTLLEEKKI